MGPQQLKQPFGDEPYDEVRLPGAPLARVLSQLRFERMAVLESTTTVSELSAALSDKYPYLDTSTAVNMVVGGGQVMPQSAHHAVWRLRSADRANTVTLTNGSLALETTSYSGREDFCRELLAIAEALQDVVKVPAFSRIGVRYTNQVTGEPLQNLSSYLRPEIAGISATTLGGASLQHSLTQAAFSVGEGLGLVAQWGIMPPNAGFDPALPRLEERSYILDLDAYTQDAALSSKPSTVRDEALILAERAYRFFRWAVTDQFLRHYGGAV